ncbi:hypothetical protein BD414DRAFT_474097 [Trametes punicea]|nr:hypothetical protein BD414DRAFT_474097 [Trametes punicea]
MTRFRCPSVSSVSSARSCGSMTTIKSAGKSQMHRTGLATVKDAEAPVAGPSTARFPAQRNEQADSEPVPKRDKGKGKARTRAKMDIGQKEKLRMARKKAELKANARLPQAEWSFVFVGNLSSSVTEQELEALFERCGKIRRIQIRASSGVCVPTANLKSSFFGYNKVEPGVHYATVEYMTPAEARKALELSGTELHGRNILVSLSVVDLPETSNIVKSHITKKDAHLQKRTLWQAKFGQLKRLTIERTEYIPDGEQRGGPGRLLEGVAKRLGLYDPAGSTAAGAHQNAEGGRFGLGQGPGQGARHPPPLAKQFTFPKTLM